MATGAQRAHIGRLLDALVEHHYSVRYPPHDVRTRKASEIRTQAQFDRALADGAFEFDCSQTAEIVCVVAGLRWPAKMVNGYTGTMLDGLPHYGDPRAAALGALCVFGPYPGVHVVQVRHGGVFNPTVFSHGSDRSAYFTSLSVERTYHPAPAVFLSIAGL